MVDFFEASTLGMDCSNEVVEEHTVEMVVHRLRMIWRVGSPSTRCRPIWRSGGVPRLHRCILIVAIVGIMFTLHALLI